MDDALAPDCHSLSRFVRRKILRGHGHAQAWGVLRSIHPDAARAGYSTLNGVFITLVCLTGSMALIAWALPADAGLSIVVWIGLVIAVKSFEVTPVRHWTAIVIGMAPVILAWTTFFTKNAMRISGMGAPRA